MIFWISKNSFITPITHSEHSFDGNVIQKGRTSKDYKINGLNYKFIKHFRHKTQENKDLLQWSFLASECTLNIRASETDKILQNQIQFLDDFLLLTSLASRHKTVCLGWEAYDNQNYVTFYRGNYSFPKEKENDINDCLINVLYFDDYIKTSKSTFDKYQNKSCLRNSINSLLSSKETYLESSFITLFSGLETLILDFRRREKYELILDEKEWKLLRKTLEVTIKKLDIPALDSCKRNLIYSKLNEINRVSLRDAFSAFCSYYSIPFNDLWPIFGDKELAGLSDIRNRIAHGDPLPHSAFDLLISAKFHLEILLERSLLRILNFDLNKSNVNFIKLKNYNSTLLEFRENSLKFKKIISTS